MQKKTYSERDTTIAFHLYTRTRMISITMPHDDFKRFSYIFRFIFLVCDKLYACCIYWCDFFLLVALKYETWKSFKIDDKKYYARPSDRGWWCVYALTHENIPFTPNHFKMKFKYSLLSRTWFAAIKILSLKSKQHYANAIRIFVFDEAKISMKNIFKWNVRKTKMRENTM